MYDDINGLDDLRYHDTRAIPPDHARPVPLPSIGHEADVREAAKLDPYVPRVDGDNRAWWERVAEFGLTRAIDSHFGPPAVNKTGATGTFAGQNGLTYPISGAPGAIPYTKSDSGNGMLLLVVAALAAFALAG